MALFALFNIRHENNTCSQSIKSVSLQDFR